MKKILPTYILLSLILIGGATPCTTQCDGAGLWLWEKLQVCSTWIVLTHVIDRFVENGIHKDNENKPANNSTTKKQRQQQDKQINNDVTINDDEKEQPFPVAVGNFIWNNFPFNKRQMTQGGIAAALIMSYISNLLHSTPEAPQQNVNPEQTNGAPTNHEQ